MAAPRTSAAPAVDAAVPYRREYVPENTELRYACKRPASFLATVYSVPSCSVRTTSAPAVDWGSDRLVVTVAVGTCLLFTWTANGDERLARGDDRRSVVVAIPLLTADEYRLTQKYRTASTARKHRLD
jgi:hypothetical protein